MKRKMNIKKIFTNLAFAFICIFSIGVMNVNAETVTVETEGQLKTAVQKRYTDDVIVIKLVDDITFENNSLDIWPINDFTLDLNGHILDFQTNSKRFYIDYGMFDKEYITNLTIKDSSDSKSGIIKAYEPILISNRNSYESPKKNMKFTIEGGKFYSSSSYGYIFEVASNEYYDKDKNIILDFQVKDGYFETSQSNGVLLYTYNTNTNNVKLNINLDKLTMKGKNARLVYSNELDFKVDDVVSEDSKIKLKHTTLHTEGALLNDRTVSVTKLNALWEAIGFDFDTIEVIKADGFDVSDVTLNETYGYGTATAKGIKITNRGANPLKVKTVSVSNTDGTDSANFEVVGTTQPTLAAGATDETSYTIKAKPGLAAGEYTAVITVTDEHDKTYTSTVKVVVAKKSVEGLGIGYAENWKYGEEPTALTVSSAGLSVGQYKVEYATKDSNDWFEEVPTLAGDYVVRIRVTDSNYVDTTSSSTFSINPDDTQIKIVPNKHEWTYDGKSHSDNGYKVYYGSDTEGTTGLLPTGDTIKAVITGSVTDYVDNKTGNNKITSYSITNSDGVDVKGCYSNIIVGTGNLTIKPIETKIYVTADSATKAYDGSALTKDSYTYTNDVLVAGDKLKATITGSQTFVGTSNNVVTDVKVYRGEKDITSNYRFGTHVDGTLKVEAASQNPTIATQYVVKGKVITFDVLKQAVSGTEGNLDFEIVSGDSLVEYVEGTGYKAKDLGTVEMKVTAQSLNVGGDASPEYSEGSTTFNLEITNKIEVEIGGITDNQEFTYDGNTHTPAGTLTFSNPNVTTSDLEISYAGRDGTTYSSTTAPTNAGTYNVTYKIKDSNENYAGEKAFKFTIKKVQLAKVTLVKDSFEYTGEDIVTEPVNYYEDLMNSIGTVHETNVGNYTIVVGLINPDNYEWEDGTTADLELGWSITKANPSYTVPTNLTGLKGQKLSDIELPARFTWNDASRTLIVGTHTYTAKYTPKDTVNYNVIDNIEITVVTKNLFNVSTEVVGGNGDITDPFHNVVEGSTEEITFIPNTGYMIDEVKVNGTPVTVTNNKLTLTVDGNKDVKVSYKKIPFTITVVDTEGAIIDPSGSIAVNYGDSKQFTIYADYGYNFVKVLVDGVDKTDEMVGDTLTLDNITASMEIEVVVEKIEYEVIEGANQKYTITKDTEAKFRIDAEYGLFMQGGKVYVDDELVDEDNYTTEEGSTIVTLKQSYVDTLSVGEHTLKVTFADGGVATTNFTIAKVTPAIDNPKTGDNIALYITTGILSVVGLIGASVIVIRRKQEN